MVELSCNHHGVVCNALFTAQTHEEALELLENHKADTHHVVLSELSPAHQQAYLAWMDRLDR